MTENREPRFLDEDARNWLLSAATSLDSLVEVMRARNWQIKEDDMSQLDEDLFGLKQLKDRMEYTYYVE